MRMRFHREVWRRDEQLPRHAQVQHHAVAAREMKDEELPAPSERCDRLLRQEADERFGRWMRDDLCLQQADSADCPSCDLWFYDTADGFDFRQFWHSDPPYFYLAVSYPM